MHCTLMLQLTVCSLKWRVEDVVRCRGPVLPWCRLSGVSVLYSFSENRFL